MEKFIPSYEKRSKMISCNYLKIQINKNQWKTKKNIIVSFPSWTLRVQIPLPAPDISRGRKRIAYGPFSFAAAFPTCGWKNFPIPGKTAAEKYAQKALRQLAGVPFFQSSSSVSFTIFMAIWRTRIPIANLAVGLTDDTMTIFFK